MLPSTMRMCHIPMLYSWKARWRKPFPNLRYPLLLPLTQFVELYAMSHMRSCLVELPYDTCEGNRRLNAVCIYLFSHLISSLSHVSLRFFFSFIIFVHNVPHGGKCYTEKTLYARRRRIEHIFTAQHDG